MPGKLRPVPCRHGIRGDGLEAADRVEVAIPPFQFGTAFESREKPTWPPTDVVEQALSRRADVALLSPVLSFAADAALESSVTGDPLRRRGIQSCMEASSIRTVAGALRMKLPFVWYLH